MLMQSVMRGELSKDIYKPKHGVMDVIAIPYVASDAGYLQPLSGTENGFKFSLLRSFVFVAEDGLETPASSCEVGPVLGLSGTRFYLEKVRDGTYFWDFGEGRQDCVINTDRSFEVMFKSPVNGTVLMHVGYSEKTIRALGRTVWPKTTLFDWSLVARNSEDYEISPSQKLHAMETKRMQVGPIRCVLSAHPPAEGFLTELDPGVYASVTDRIIWTKDMVPFQFMLSETSVRLNVTRALDWAVECGVLGECSAVDETRTLLIGVLYTCRAECCWCKPLEE